MPARRIQSAVFSIIAIGVLSRLLQPELFPDARLLSVLPQSNLDALGLGALLACATAGRVRGSLALASKAGIPVYLCLFVLRAWGLSLPLHRQLERLALLLALTWTVNGASVAVRRLGHAIGFPNLEYDLPGLILKAILTVVAASLSWRYLEAPINRLKRRFPYQASA